MRECGKRVLALGAALGLALGSSARAGDAPAAGADTVLASAARALGAGNLGRLNRIHATATGTQYGLSAQIESYTSFAAGGAFAAYTKLGGFAQDTGYDGRAAWTRDTKGVVWVDGSEQGHAAAINEAFRESYTLWTPSRGGASVALLPPRSDGDRSFDIVRVSVPGSVVPFDLWIDRVTHLPDRYVETAAAVTTTTRWSDYRSVAGVAFPFAVHALSDQGNRVDEQISSIDDAPADGAARLRKPDSDVHDYSIAGAPETSVPFDLIDNHVYLDVRLNGKGPYRFIFDTGGSNVVDPAVAKAIGATAEGSAQGEGVGATTEGVTFAPVSSLRVGEAELRDQLFAVLPVHAGFGISGSAPVDGLIGAEVLARFVTVFDYQRGRVILKLPGAPAAGSALAFVFSGTQPQVPCTIDHIATQCSIDSGSRSSLDLLSPFIAANPSVVPADATAPGLNGFGVGGGDVGRLGRLGSLELGGFELKNLVAGYSSATAGAFAVPGIAANIGGGVLKRFTVTYDYPHQTMSLVPNGSLGTPDRYERSGMFVINTGKFVIAGVRPGTPAADAGIAKGDVIAGLDGIASGQLTLAAIRDALKRPSGTRVELSVLRSGASAPHDVVLTLRDYV